MSQITTIQDKPNTMVDAFSLAYYDMQQKHLVFVDLNDLTNKRFAQIPEQEKNFYFVVPKKNQDQFERGINELIGLSKFSPDEFNETYNKRAICMTDKKDLESTLMHHNLYDPSLSYVSNNVRVREYDLDKMKPDSIDSIRDSKYYFCIPEDKMEMFYKIVDASKGDMEVIKKLVKSELGVDVFDNKEEFKKYLENVMENNKSKENEKTDNTNTPDNVPQPEPTPENESEKKQEVNPDKGERKADNENAKVDKDNQDNKDKDQKVNVVDDVQKRLKLNLNNIDSSVKTLKEELSHLVSSIHNFDEDISRIESLRERRTFKADLRDRIIKVQNEIQAIPEYFSEAFRFVQEFEAVSNTFLSKLSPKNKDQDNKTKNESKEVKVEKVEKPRGRSMEI